MFEKLSFSWGNSKYFFTYSRADHEIKLHGKIASRSYSYFIIYKELKNKLTSINEE